ncbi:MAG TPA: hypothetical protein VKD91_09620 [Pyrinomonadaceae bacterium]|nr:hypothetical protein [Pyrinomonadaceae bacterium]
MNNLPIACNLTAAELQERRRSVLERLRDAVVEVKEVSNGFVYSFTAEESRCRELADMIDLERQCCPFLEFQLTVSGAGGPLRLEITGPDGTKDFLSSTFEWRPS